MQELSANEIMKGSAGTPGQVESAVAGGSADAAELERLRSENARIAAERNALAAETQRLAHGWTAISEELKASKRRNDFSEGDRLIASARVRELETRLEKVLNAQKSLQQQFLYRLLLRAGMLKSLEGADEPAR